MKPINRHLKAYGLAIIPSILAMSCGPGLSNGAFNKTAAVGDKHTVEQTPMSGTIEQQPMQEVPLNQTLVAPEQSLPSAAPVDVPTQNPNFLPGLGQNPGPGFGANQGGGPGIADNMAAYLGVGTGVPYYCNPTKYAPNIIAANAACRPFLQHGGAFPILGDGDGPGFGPGYGPGPGPIIGPEGRYPGYRIRHDLGRRRSHHDDDDDDEEEKSKKGGFGKSFKGRWKSINR